MKQLHAKRQSGMILLVTLVVLLIIAILGLASTDMTGMSERMASNSDDSNGAVLAAEAAVLAAEIVMEAETSLADYQANANGKYEDNGVGVEPRWETDATWAGANSIEVAYSGAPQNPRYIIEFVKTVFTEEDRLNMDNVGGGTGSDRTQIFRVTALGWGPSGTSTALIQSTYGKKL